MTADPKGLRDAADTMVQFVEWRTLLREAADAIEQLTIYNSTNREIADRAERAEARLAAAERVISAARPISAMNNGLIRYSGPQMSELFDLLSAALDGYEKAYKGEQS